MQNQDRIDSFRQDIGLERSYLISQYQKMHRFIINAYVANLLGRVRNKLDHFEFLEQADDERFKNNPEMWPTKQEQARNLREECLKYVDEPQHVEDVSSMSTSVLFYSKSTDKEERDHVSVDVQLTFRPPTTMVVAPSPRSMDDLTIEVSASTWPLINRDKLNESLVNLSQQLAVGMNRCVQQLFEDGGQ